MIPRKFWGRGPRRNGHVCYLTNAHLARVKQLLRKDGNTKDVSPVVSVRYRSATRHRGVLRYRYMERGTCLRQRPG